MKNMAVFIKEIYDAMGHENRIFALTAVCFIITLLVATFVVNRWMKKHQEGR